MDGVAAGCLLSVRLVGSAGTICWAADPFVESNRLSNEGTLSPGPLLFLAFFKDRKESSMSMSRLSEPVLDPADDAC